METASLDADADGTAAFNVLSNRQLFGDIVAWSTGWPALVALRWREIKAARDVAVLPTRDFLWELIWEYDLRTLELTKRIHNRRFLVDDISPAIAAGDADAVRLALEFSAPAYELLRHQYWALAIDQFPGHVDVLEELDTFEPLDEMDLQLSMRQCNRIRTQSERVVPTIWGLSVARIDSVVLAEWLIAKFGPACLPRSLIHTVALRGNLALVCFLDTFVNQEIERQTFHGVYCLTQQHQSTASNTSFSAVLDFLLRHREEQHTREFELACLEAGDHAMLELIGRTRGLHFLDNVNIDVAASRGHLEVIHCVASRGRVTCTSDAMDDAAANGHLHVVAYLHATGTVGCTRSAMDEAAGNGHLEVVQFLHNSRNEGCTTRAMDVAAAHGFLDVVQFLHANRHEGCTTEAMDQAAQSCCRSVADFLHANRRKRCTAADYVYPQATTNDIGQQRVANVRLTLLFLLEHRKEMHSNRLEYDALRFRDLEVLSLIERTRGLQYVQAIDIDDFAGEGNVALIRFLVEHVSVTCTASAMDVAAAKGHLEVVKYLHETRTEGCTTAAMDMAANANHWDVVAFLDEHRNEGCTPVLLNAAVRLGRLDLVQWYSKRVPTLARSAAVFVAGAYGHVDIQEFLRNDTHNK